MFEKEAEYYAFDEVKHKQEWYIKHPERSIDEDYEDIKKHWEKGAEFGYNKANEWHYPLTLDKDGQPISDNPIAEFYPVEILMYDFETGSKEVIKYDTSWGYYRKDGNSIRRNHIAWQYISIPNKEKLKKEIVLPKESE